MKRREFIAGIGVAAAWPFIVRAQQSATTKRVAFVNPTIKVGEMRIGGDSAYAALFVELGRLGYVEGKNLIVDRYSAEGQRERYGDLAREVVGTHPCGGSTQDFPRSLYIDACSLGKPGGQERPRGGAKYGNFGEKCASSRDCEDEAEYRRVLMTQSSASAPAPGAIIKCGFELR
jgi:hypothetical protein